MNRIRGFAFLLATSTMLLAGCSSATTANGASGTATRSSQNQLSRDDLAGANADNLYDAVAKLRPNWRRMLSLCSRSASLNSLMVILSLPTVATVSCWPLPRK